MRALVVDAKFREDCRRLREYAEDPKNWYRCGQAKEVPGELPEYVISTATGYKIVFTITHAPDQRPKPFRHLTVSVPSENYAHPDVVLLLANMLGFTGAELDGDSVLRPGPWGFGIDEDEGCVVVQQPYEHAVAKEEA